MTDVDVTPYAEYLLNDYALVGGPFNYDSSSLKLSNSNGKTNSDSLPVWHLRHGRGDDFSGNGGLKFSF